MDKLKQWTIMISTVAIISGILSLILPERKMKAAYKILVGTLLVYAFVYPLMKPGALKIDINGFLSDNYAVSESYDKYALSAATASANRAIEEILASHCQQSDINARFKAECILEDDRSYINKIEAIGSFTDESRRKITEIAEGLGLNKEILIFSEE